MKLLSRLDELSRFCVELNRPDWTLHRIAGAWIVLRDFGRVGTDGYTRWCGELLLYVDADGYPHWTPIGNGLARKRELLVAAEELIREYHGA